MKPVRRSYDTGNVASGKLNVAFSSSVLSERGGLQGNKSLMDVRGMEIPYQSVLTDSKKCER